MPSALAAAALALLLAVPADGGDDPAAVVRQATRAVEGDSVARVRERWVTRLGRDPADRPAALGLASLARLTYDYPAAERLYRWLFADSLRGDRYAAYARLGLAQGLEDRGFSTEALAQFESARATAQRAGDAAAEAEALLWLSFIRARVEGLGVAEALLDTAGRLIPDTALALRARRHNRRAIVHALRGRPEALAEADSGIALARRGGDLRTEAEGFRVLGQVLQYRLQLDSAVVVLRRAEQLYRRARSRSALAASLVWRAQVQEARGELGEMQAAMWLALAEGEATHNPKVVATAYRALGGLAMNLGDFATAAQRLNGAAAISRKSGDSAGVMLARTLLAPVALAAGDLAEAKRAAREALAFYRRQGEPKMQYDAHWTLADVAARQRDWAGAELALADARALLPRLTGTAYRSMLVLAEGQLALARGDLGVAERSFTSYRVTLDTASSAKDPGVFNRRYDVGLRLADIYARRGELSRAEREMLRASEELDRWRASLGDRELRVRVFQITGSAREAALEAAERDARVARVLAALAAGGRAPVAFELAERRRARELADRLLQAEALRVGCPAGGCGRPRAADSSAWRDPAPLTAGEIAPWLSDGRTALLEFVGGADGAPTTVFVVQRTGVDARVLPRADSLASRAARLVALLEAGGEPGALAQSLGTSLLEPAIARLPAGVSRLVIVPDGALHAVPWDAIRLSGGGYAVERFAISTAPSAAVLAALRRRALRPRAPGAAPVRALAFGDPAFPAEGAARRAGTSGGAAAETYSAFDSAGGLARLEASAGEARLVARYAPQAEVRLRERASAAFLKSASLDSFRVVHFATHALVDERSVARTALALAPGGGESGFVGPGDLAALRMRADVVVLSACRTARGAMVEGEGVQGLTAPLLEAGARSVVATQWRIGDRSTVRFVDDFYRSLARGAPVGDALRAAKLESIRRGRPAAEWAAFTIVGDPTVTIPLRASGPGWSRRGGVVAAAAFGLAALVLYAAYSLRTRRRRMGEAR